MEASKRASVVVQLDADLDSESLDIEYRRLSRDLSAEIPGTEFDTSDPPPHAKGEIGLLSGIVIPLTMASIPVIADKLHTFLASRREKCTLIVTGQDGDAIEVTGLKPTEIPEAREEVIRFLERQADQTGSSKEEGRRVP